MDEKFTYWYPLVEEIQLDFEKRPHIRPVLKTGHIVYNGRLMCGESMEKLKNEVGAKKEKVVKSREVTPKMCPVCLELWKANPESKYYAWFHGTPSKVVGTERVVYEAQAST